MTQLVAKLSKRQKVVKPVCFYDEDILELNLITKGKIYMPLDSKTENGVEMFLIINDNGNETWICQDYFNL